MSNDLFRDDYERESGSIPVNERLQKKLAAKMGFGKKGFFSRSFSFPRLAAFGTAAAVLTLVLWSPAFGVPYAVIPERLSAAVRGWGKTGSNLATAYKSIPAKIAGRTDDWQHPQNAQLEYGGMGQAVGLSSGSGGRGVDLGLSYATAIGLGSSGSAMQNAPSASHRIGYSVGGAKDIVNFRRNIENGYLPLPTDITYEGLYYEYFFDTGEKEVCRELFCPSYSTAVSRDPVSGKDDYYLSVGLNSGMTEADFQRQDLDLVIVLDISGSMSSGFAQYYYDQGAAKQDVAEPQKTKMAAAAESVNALIDNLRGTDRLSVVLFNDRSWIAKPMRSVAETDIEAIKRHVSEIQANGGTNMEAGMQEADALFDGGISEGRQKRVIFLTDAMPNTGDISDAGLLGMVRRNAERGVYTTFIGIGVDFQSELVEALTKTEGANYYAVRSPKEFRVRMDEGFDFMVTPLVFDLNMDLTAEGFEIAQVYGSPEANEATGELMRVRTLFPSKTEGGETRGGLVLLKLRKISENGDLKLRLSYKDAKGVAHAQASDVSFGAVGAEKYETSGIRKGIWLARYADLLKNWTIDERIISEEPMYQPMITEDTGIIDPRMPPGFASKWERRSVPLRVSPRYAGLFRDFRARFAEEIAVLGDETLRQELDVLDRLSER